MRLWMIVMQDVTLILMKGDKMLIVFNAYMAIMYDEDQKEEAIRCAANNAARVVNTETDECLADFRTPESEVDERG